MKTEKSIAAGSAKARWYDDACGTALALELVGERWSLLIARELMFGPRRFNDLKASLGGISANILTQRLEGLEQAGILVKKRLPPPANVQVYELTPWGYESEPAIQALGRWAVRSPAHDPTLPLSAASLMLSLRTMYAGGMRGTLGFTLGRDIFVARLEPDAITIVRDDPAMAEAALAADAAPAIAAILYGGRPLADAEADGSVVVTGSRAVIADFLTRFPLPPKIG